MATSLTHLMGILRPGLTDIVEWVEGMGIYTPSNIDHMRAMRAAQMANVRAYCDQVARQSATMNSPITQVATAALGVAAPAVANQDAVRRSKEFLCDALTHVQLRRFAIDGSFEVKGSRSPHIYRITTGTVANIYRDDGCVYCAHADARSRVPVYDSMLAQKILLELDEGAFLRVANKMGGGETLWIQDETTSVAIQSW